MAREELQPTVTWPEVFIGMAQLMSTRSRDPSTKVGAILASPDHRRVITGFNGFANGLPNYKEWWETRGPSVLSKDTLVRHAEENCFSNLYEDATGWEIYVTHHPCVRCASLCAHHKLSKVHYLQDVNARYNPHLAKEVLKEAGIPLIQLTIMPS